MSCEMEEELVNSSKEVKALMEKLRQVQQKYNTLCSNNQKLKQYHEKLSTHGQMHLVDSPTQQRSQLSPSVMTHERQRGWGAEGPERLSRTSLADQAMYGAPWQTQQNPLAHLNTPLDALVSVRMGGESPEQCGGSCEFQGPLQTGCQKLSPMSHYGSPTVTCIPYDVGYRLAGARAHTSPTRCAPHDQYWLPAPMPHPSAGPPSSVAGGMQGLPNQAQEWPAHSYEVHRHRLMHISRSQQAIPPSSGQQCQPRYTAAMQAGREASPHEQSRYTASMQAGRGASPHEQSRYTAAMQAGRGASPYEQSRDTASKQAGRGASPDEQSRYTAAMQAGRGASPNEQSRYTTAMQAGRGASPHEQSRFTASLQAGRGASPQSRYIAAMQARGGASLQGPTRFTTASLSSAPGAQTDRRYAGHMAEHPPCTSQGQIQRNDMGPSATNSVPSIYPGSTEEMLTPLNDINIAHLVALSEMDSHLAAGMVEDQNMKMLGSPEDAHMKLFESPGGTPPSASKLLSHATEDSREDPGSWHVSFDDDPLYDALNHDF